MKACLKAVCGFFFKVSKSLLFPEHTANPYHGKSGELTHKVRLVSVSFNLGSQHVEADLWLVYHASVCCLRNAVC